MAEISIPKPNNHLGELVSAVGLVDEPIGYDPRILHRPIPGELIEPIGILEDPGQRRYINHDAISKLHRQNNTNTCNILYLT